MERTILKSRDRSNRAAREMLEWVFSSELLGPSEEIWIVMGWMSDVVILDSSDGSFDSLIPSLSGQKFLLSDIVVELARLGSRIFIVIRSDESNNYVTAAMKAKIEQRCPKGKLKIHQDAEVHNKGIIGSSWCLDGSMNLTSNGLDRNAESLTLLRNSDESARRRIELRGQWGKYFGGEAE